MATGGSGAVFFLGTRAHYQVLNQPEAQFDIENGNASTETIYRNPSVQELFPRDQNQSATSVQELWPKEKKEDNERWEYTENTVTEDVSCLYYARAGSYSQCRLNNSTDTREMEYATKRSRRRTSETALCERDDMKPALLNSLGESTPQKKCSKAPLLTFLWSLTRRKRKLDDEVQYLQHIDTALTSCTYRESCRCLDCQSRYFECDDSDEEYSSDDSYEPRYYPQVIPEQVYQKEEEEDDEVFIDTVPGDNTSTDLLLDNTKMSVSSDETIEPSQSEAEHNLQLEVAAGTPVLLNYLLTHPITCNIQ